MRVRDTSLLESSFLITMVLIVIVLSSGVMADMICAPALIGLGATPEQFQQSSNCTWFAQHSMLFVGFALTLFPLSFWLMKYLQYGNIFENGLFGLPWKRDIYGNYETRTS